MRHIFLSLIVFAFVLSIPNTAKAVGALEKSFGISMGYTGGNESASAGLYFQWSPNSVIRLSPRAMYIFRKNGRDAFNFDLDVHFPLSLEKSEKWRIYPLVGAGYYLWNRVDDLGANLGQYDDATTRTARLSLNVGAGLEWLPSPTLKLSLQGREAFMKRFSTSWVTVSIGYVF